jgi:hypothetical protein
LKTVCQYTNIDLLDSKSKYITKLHESRRFKGVVHIIDYLIFVRVYSNRQRDVQVWMKYLTYTSLLVIRLPAIIQPFSEYPSRKISGLAERLARKLQFIQDRASKVRSGGGISPSCLVVKRRYGHRDCRQKPDAFSPYDPCRTFRRGLPRRSCV